MCSGFMLCLHAVQDADLSPNRLRMAYTEMVMIIRNLYQDCRLVHGDLSEYNILFHEVRHLCRQLKCMHHMCRHGLIAAFCLCLALVALPTLSRLT